MDARIKKYAVVGAAIILVLYAVFGDRELLDLWRAQKERNNIRADVKKLEAGNTDLEEKIRLLKIDKRYIAYAARVDLGMIGKDEIIYRVGASSDDVADKSAR